MRILNGLAEVADRYDAAILDSWGVLHNGVEPYAGVLECLARMRAAGWRTVVLSNAPRQGEAVARQVAGFGVPADAYDAIVTSGDLARAALRDRSDAAHRDLGRRLFHLGPERDWGLLDGLAYERADDISACDFVLNTGLYNDETETAADYAELLSEALARHLPMLCANPDLEVNRGGKRVPCAGAVAAAYARIGGDVAYHGKPARAAFEACLRKLPGVARERVLVVGDSLATDIAGAAASEIDALFVTGGIHAGEFGPELNEDAVERLLRSRGAVAAAAIRSLTWS
ncbi:MAG: TIGR01459 family HAD-type hydrolase [Proteobacteria bacterium]|nr:TIGR01459 family HAD-type hydrolase [Pseudomonadota bacterium]